MKNLSNAFQKRDGAKWFDIKNATAESADVFLYDYIGDSYIGSDAASFVKQLQSLSTKKINLRINSPGGSVFDGIAIHNALARHPAEVTTYIDGIAASIASIIALAGKKVIIAENGMMMIHMPWTIAAGDSLEMRKQADVLDQVAETLITTYATRTGASRESIKAKMEAETWFTAKEAVEAKLADEVAPGVKAAACFDLKAYGYAKAPDAVTQISVENLTTNSPLCRPFTRRQALIELTNK